MKTTDKILGYRDLDVYKTTYDTCIVTIKEIVNKLPKREQYDLADQLLRSCKAIPRLIAEGYAKKHQKFGFQKYLYDALGECNETTVSLCQCKDLYKDCLDINLINKLLDLYDKAGRQLYNLSKSLNDYKKRISNSK